MEAIPWRVGSSSSERGLEKITCSTDDSCEVEKQYSEDEISAMIQESREASTHLGKLGRVMKAVATHRLKELRHLQAVEKLAT